MGRLTPRASDAFQRHSACCPSCAQISNQEKEFLAAIRAALREMEQSCMYRCSRLVFQSSVSIPASGLDQVAHHLPQYRVRIASHRATNPLPGILLIREAKFQED
jgi:hypothetical protein